MTHPDTPAAGPLRHATLIVADARPLVEAYAALGLVAGAAQTIDGSQARAWGQPALARRHMVPLATRPGGDPLLRLIEVPAAPPRPTRHSHGWLALEILVRDVDDLAARLSGPGWQIVGAPADLDVSPSIRAMQVVGPAGEMLYLTQVKAPVPPFQIPLSDALPAQQALGPLFIAVMSVPSRSDALAACAGLAPLQTLQFETKVSVLNRTLGRDLATRWPVATTQWAGQCLFEIDEVVDRQVGAPAAPGVLPTGLAWIGIEVRGAAPALRELAPGVWIEPLARR